MGFLDYFRTSAGRFQAPRCSHYTFAHLAFRTVALGDPHTVLAVLADDTEGRAFLVRLLESVAEDCKKRERGPHLSIDEVSIHCARVGTYPAVAIEFPEPQAYTECYLVCLVNLSDPDAVGMTPAPPRYFTLELGEGEEGDQITILGEWDGSGHLHHGEGPAPQLGEFLAAVSRILIGSD